MWQCAGQETVGPREKDKGVLSPGTAPWGRGPGRAGPGEQRKSQILSHCGLRNSWDQNRIKSPLCFFESLGVPANREKKKKKEKKALNTSISYLNVDLITSVPCRTQN